MGTQSVSPPGQPPAWKQKAETLEARATWFQPRSRRGLLNKVFIVRRCPCGESHEFHAAGLRIAPCGQRLVIKARRARRTK